MQELEKIFFNPGDVVTLKYTEFTSPVMYVVEKVTRSFKKEEETVNTFRGIKCRWFDNNMVLQEAIFSTKDLTFYKK